MSHAIIEFPSVSGAKLPAVYEAAKAAISKCSKIDECQEWADKAEALASYAKQSEDNTLRKHADRIQARAIRRCGELLKQIAPARGANQNIQEGARPNVTRESAATDAGLSEHQRKTALRVANVDEKSFTAQVESDSPPTVTQLAEQGTTSLVNLNGRSPKDFALATQALATLRRFSEFCKQHDAAQVAAGVSGAEATRARDQIDIIDGWLDRFVTHLE